MVESDGIKTGGREAQLHQNVVHIKTGELKQTKHRLKSRRRKVAVIRVERQGRRRRDDEGATPGYVVVVTEQQQQQT